MLVVALINVNILVFLGAWIRVPNDIVVQAITAVLFLVGVYTGVQGGVDMIQQNKTDYSKQETTVTETKTINKKEDVDINEKRDIRIEEIAPKNAKEEDYRLD